MVSVGGDVRLHDAWGKAPFHYIEDQEDPKKRKKIQKYLIGMVLTRVLFLLLEETC